jgi:resuscitation-promoting factor RpfB
VSLFNGGQTQIITTDAGTVGEVLDRAGIKLEEGDVVEPAAGTAIPRGLFNINIYRARPAVVVDGDEVLRLRSAYESPRLIAADAGIATYPEDIFETEVVTDFVGDRSVGLKVSIQRSTPVTLAADGKEQLLRTQAKTVGELIEEKKIAMGERDTTAPGLDAPLYEGMRIAITRVAEVISTKQEVLPRATKNIKDPNLDIGHTKVVDEGSDGGRTVTYRIRYHNGQEVGRDTLKVDNLVNPKTKVVAVGTRIPDDVWYRLRMCESGGRYDRNSGNGYYGAYQFDLSTWRSNGGTGYPHEAAPAVQDAIAKKVQSLRGWQPWPGCRIKLGLP